MADCSVPKDGILKWEKEIQAQTWTDLAEGDSVSLGVLEVMAIG